MQLSTNSRKVNIWVSARHVHLNEEDLYTLFKWELTHFKDLSQPWQYAANEKVDLYWPMTIPWNEWSRKVIKWVRILWPTRSETQIELTATEARWLWINNAPLRLSWDLEWTPWIKITWPQGEVETEKWVIIVQRHLHITPKQANERGLKDGDQVIIGSHDRTRQKIMTDVIVRVSKSAALDVHIDTEEGNAMWINNWSTWLILDPEEIQSFLSKNTI
jgi:putative phosphotransacetylase